jgi:hypothetical protein
MPIIEDEQDQQNLEKEENPVLEEDVSEEETQENDKTDETDSEEESPVISDEDDSEIVLSLGDDAEEEEPTPSTQLLRDLRKANREKNRRIKELESQINRPVQKTVLGPKPTLESTDYDAEEFEKKLEEWYTKKSVVDAEEAKQRQEEEDQKRQWENKLSDYEKSKTSLRVRDYEEAEATVQELFNVTQQGMILEGALNPAALVYVLGKNPEKAAKFAKINNPVAFAFEMGRLEKDIKMTKKTTPSQTIPAPERMVQSTGKTSSNGTLERLRKEAEISGDYTKVVSYKKQLANKK